MLSLSDQKRADHGWVNLFQKQTKQTKVNIAVPYDTEAALHQTREAT
jgi:hypothetical protein